MSDVPSLTRKEEFPTVDPALVGKVSEALDSFNKQASFLGEGLNELQKSFMGKQKSQESSEQTPFTEEGINHENVLPKKESLLKYGGVMGAAAVYLGEMLGETSKVGKEEGGGLFSNMMGAMGMSSIANKLFPALAKVLPFAAIAGGIIWGVIDATIAVGKADEWGVSGVEAAIGGFIGGTGEGIANAFKNAGKWALIGAGAGAFSGPVGAIAGGLVGAAIGGIYGFIGGEKIAQFISQTKEAIASSPLINNVIDRITDMFNGMIDGAIEAFNDVVNIDEILSGDGNFGAKLSETVTTIFSGLGNAIFGGISGGWDALLGEGNMFSKASNILRDIFNSMFDNIITEPFKKLFSGLSDTIGNIVDIWKGEGTIGEKLGESIGTLIDGIFVSVSDMITSLADGVKNIFLDFFVGTKDREGKRTKKSLSKKLGEFLLEMGKGMIAFMGDIVSGLFKSVRDSASFAWIEENIIEPVIGFFGMVGDKIRGLGENIIDAGVWVKDNILLPIGNAVGNAIRTSVDVAKKAVEWVGNNIITPVGEFFVRLGGNIRDAFTSVVDFFKFNVVWPIRNFFATIGEFFGAFEGKNLREAIGMIIKGDLDEESEARRESKIRDIGIQEGIINANTMHIDSLKELLRKQEVWFPGAKRVDDLILTPQGQAYQTSPDDTILAIKDLSSIVAGQTDEQLREIEREKMQVEINQTNRMIQLLTEINQGMGGQKSNNNVFTQNIMSRYNPNNIMASLTATGEL